MPACMVEKGRLHAKAIGFFFSYTSVSRTHFHKSIEDESLPPLGRVGAIDPVNCVGGHHLPALQGRPADTTASSSDDRSTSGICTHQHSTLASPSRKNSKRRRINASPTPDSQSVLSAPTLTKWVHHPPFTATRVPCPSTAGAHRTRTLTGLCSLS